MPSFGWSRRRSSPVILASLTILAIHALGCRRESPRPIIADPSVPDAKKTRPDAGPPPPLSMLRLHDGAVVDLGMLAKRDLEKDRPLRSDAHGDTAYAFLSGGFLKAYDMKTGVPLWSVSRPTCGILRALAGGVVCTDTVEAILYARDTGKPLGSTHFVGTMGWSQLVRVGSSVILLRDDGELESRDATTFALTGSLKFPFMPYGSRDGLVVTEDGVCGGKTDSAGVEIACIDEGATKVLRRASFTLHKPTDPVGTYFAVRATSPRRFVISTIWSPSISHRGIVVRLSDLKEEMRVDEELVDVVERPDFTLDAALVTSTSTKLLEPSGVVRWTSTEKLDESASIVLAGDFVIVGSYHGSSTGARLDALDLHTGVTRWSGLVELLPIAHSKYFNRVRVTLEEGKVLMNGEESGQRYLEIFEATTGKRLLSDLHGT